MQEGRLYREQGVQLGSGSSSERMRREGPDSAGKEYRQEKRKRQGAKV